ncbi:uncharacterized protein V1516DRAFT_684385 [Lipomyces oligophaga]|uniref:uncharacterized protein n=1 Tax=Lipomyces oligophaga TaxID=45792 RepID=UPI0034CD25A3
MSEEIYDILNALNRTSSSRITADNYSTPLIDPKSITTLPSALAFLETYLGSNPMIKDRIARMIEHQEVHEVRWYQGREAIVDKYTKRKESRKIVATMLNLLGGNATETGATDSADKQEEITELRDYDDKVYKATCDMVESMSSELRDLQIPFFCSVGLLKEGSTELLEARRAVLKRLQDLVDR